MKRSVLVIFMLLIAASVATIVLSKQEGDSRITLTVSAASSLKDVMDELGPLIQKSFPDVATVTNFGNSGSLQQQIVQGAPVDLFISASIKNMENLKSKGLLLDDTYRSLLKNRLVLIAQAESDSISGFDDLALNKVRKIALGEPGSVPAGFYAKEALTSLNLFEKIEAKFVYAKDVKEVMAWVSTGNADAGMTYLTDVKSSGKVRIVEEVPEGMCSPIIYPVGVIKNSNHPDKAKKVLLFLYSDEASGVFKKYGFETVN